jgi:hypothetical protein
VIEALGPNVIAGLGFDQLDRNAQTISNRTQAAFNDISHPEFAADLADVMRLSFVRKRGITSDDKEARDAREQRDDVFGNAVGEVFVVPAFRHVVERQNRNRGFVGERKRFARLCGVDRHRRTIGDPLPHSHRPVYVFDLSLAHVLERQVGAITHLLVDIAGDADASGFREAFQPRRNVDAIAMDIVAVDDYVAHVDADAELNPRFLRHASVAFSHRLLRSHGGTDRIDNAGKLRQHAVAHELDNTATMLGDQGIHKIVSEGLEGRECAFLVRPDQSRVSDNVRSNDRCEATFHP